MLNIGVVGKMGFDGDIPMVYRHNPATAAQVFYRLFNARCGPAGPAEHIAYLKGRHFGLHSSDGLPKGVQAQTTIFIGSILPPKI
jgi:hypothetical protein